MTSMKYNQTQPNLKSPYRPPSCSWSHHGTPGGPSVATFCAAKVAVHLLSPSTTAAPEDPTRLAVLQLQPLPSPQATSTSTAPKGGRGGSPSAAMRKTMPIPVAANKMEMTVVEAAAAAAASGSDPSEQDGVGGLDDTPEG